MSRGASAAHADLKLTLEQIYRAYHRPEYLVMDPLVCVRRFVNEPAQAELAGLLASCLAYGRFERIIRSVEAVLALVNNDPLAFALETKLAAKKRRLAGVRHRFNDGDDLALLFEAAGRAIAEHGSLGALFSRRGSDESSMSGAMDRFAMTLRRYATIADGAPRKSFEYLLPTPVCGSACKRLSMYFRWMIRPDDGLDLGVWNESPGILMMPVDVHVARTARALGLTARTVADWTTAEQITGKLKLLDPLDPVKYDFSLCRYGMIQFRQGQH